MMNTGAFEPVSGSITFGIIARFAAASAGLAVGSAATVPGDWLLDLAPGSTGYRLTLTRHDTLVDARRVTKVTASDLRGFDAASLDRPGASVRFTWVREAGTFEFRGAVENGRAAGQFWFQVNPDFEAALRNRTVSWWDPGLPFDLAVSGMGLSAVTPRAATPAPENLLQDASVRQRYLRALKEAGYPVTKDEATRLLDQGVQPDLLRQMKLSGYDSLNVTDMLRLQTLGVTPQDVRQFELRRGTGLSVDEIVRLKTNGID